ncbi:MAG: peptidase domain-containing ABC transporter [Treponema sp.]|jgi:ATP-binding cassette subfamily B protein|nr:peptidase domain-containing ABC transporter [Treponema sp.]
MKYQQQIDETDCGPACIVMAASRYSAYITPGRARDLCKTDFMGTNLAGMVRAAKQLGFQASAMRGTVSDATLNAKLLFPFIVHVKVFKDDKLFDHFVVIKKIDRQWVMVWDPDPLKGKCRINRKDFLKIWTGYVLFLSPGAGYNPKKERRGAILKFFPMLLPHKKELVIICLSSALLIVFGIVISYYYKYIVDEVIISKAAFTLTAFSIGSLFITLFQSIVEALWGVLINYVAHKAGLQLGFSYIMHVLKLTLSFFDSRRTGEILSRLSDISIIRRTLSGTLLSLVLDCILIVIIGPILFKVSGLLFGIAVANVILMSLIIFFFSKSFRIRYSRLRQEEAEVNSSLVEAIGGAYTIKSMNAEKTTGDIYEEKQMKATWTGWTTSRFGIVQGFFSELINGAIGILIFWAGSSGIIKDTFSFGTLLSFNSLLAFFTGPLFRLITIQPEIQEAYVAAERVSEILEMEVEQAGTAALLKPVSIAGEIDFSHVSFKYGMRPPVYTDLSFHIGKGQWAAFVGPSGCGKTTLVKLLLKFYRPENGAVSIDGHDLRDMDAAALRDRIGYVPQEIYIFAGTIADNIALHNPSAPMEEIIAAAEKAGADSFINNLPERYNTRLSERGSTLSGGERQRLALARALLCKPDIMILDEATSNLDSVSERIIHRTIEKLRGSMTAIIIAHRLTTIRNCDIIFVMDRGDIVESGSHDELLAKNGLYKTLWEGTAV